MLAKIQPKAVLAPRRSVPSGAAPAVKAEGAGEGAGPSDGSPETISFHGPLHPQHVGVPFVLPDAAFLPGHIDAEVSFHPHTHTSTHTYTHTHTHTHIHTHTLQLAGAITLRPTALGSKAAFVRASLQVCVLCVLSLSRLPCTYTRHTHTHTCAGS